MITKEKLLDLIKEADKAYYEFSSPILSDFEYDILRRQYIDNYGTTDLNYVPSDVSVENADFTHPYEVISLGKIKAGDDISMETWLNKKVGNISFLPVHLQKKEDGCTVVSYLIDGKLTVVTRGDGKLGKILNHIPAKYDIPFDSEFPIRSEAIFTKSDFESIQKERIKQGLEPFKNIRNAVSGVIQSKEKSPYLDKVTFVAYDVMGTPMNVDEKLRYIKEHTNYTLIEDVVCETAENAMSMIPKLFKKWNNEDHPIDGVVVKSNVHNALEVFGTTEHHPLHSFAYKAEQEGFATVLRSVEWQVGREKITAVAHFDPIEIDGTKVEKASVANIGIIREKGLSIGAEILVIKSNQIIPFVEKVLKAGDTPIVAPKNCPVCGEPLVEQNDVLFCVNDSCRGRLIQNIDHIGSKKVLNIKGISESTIEKLESIGKVKSAFDLFKLTKADFMELEGFKDKSAQNIVDAIQGGRKNVDLAHFVAACCIPHIGLTVGELLMKKYVTYESLKEALENDSYDFTVIDGIGDVINSLLHSKSFLKAYNTLHEYISPITKDTVAAPAMGRSYTFVITGRLSQPRSYFENLIKDAGSNIAGSVSKNTDYLLCEDIHSQSSKAKKARSLGVRIISEMQLADILASDGQAETPALQPASPQAPETDEISAKKTATVPAPWGEQVLLF